VDGELYWAPLISAHCGARAEEILQLLGTDISNGWISFQITRPGLQSIKSESSARRVPIQSNLVALGLPELARSAGSGRLFPGAARTKARGKLSEVFSKRFVYYRRKFFDAPRSLPDKDFHSFRGGAFTAMKRGGVSLETCQQVVGHDLDEVGMIHYYDGDTERMLRDAVETISIDISGVKRMFA